MAAPLPAAPMTADAFFDHPDVQFPMDRPDNVDFEDFVADRLKRYVDLVKNMTPGDNITTAIKAELKKIEAFCQFLKDAIRQYHRGLPHQAYAQFEQGMKLIRSEFDRFPGDVSHNFVQELYRIRVASDPGASFTKGELFHIPFHLRHKVTRQRYSIPGLPCLYLGGSLYVCWEEMRRPTFESIHVARFQPAAGQKLNIVDFMQRPPHMAQNIRVNANMANTTPLLHGYRALAVCWPLMSMTAIRRKHGDSPFIAEYIVPQLFLQWVTECGGAGIDGIGYSSVSCKTHVHYPATIANIVLPAKTIVKSGYCPDLQKKLALTEPVAWNLLARVEYTSYEPSGAGQMIEFVPGKSTAYRETEFASVEGKLLGFNAAVM